MAIWNGSVKNKMLDCVLRQKIHMEARGTNRGQILLALKRVSQQYGLEGEGDVFKLKL